MFRVFASRQAQLLRSSGAVGVRRSRGTRAHSYATIRRCSGCALAIGLLAAASPGHALALEPGVHVDPGSPAGKEYAFPLASARGISGGGPGATAQGSPAAPSLFGAGITRRSSQSRASSVGSTPGRTRTPTSRGTSAPPAAPGLSGSVLGEVHRLESPPSDPINESVAALVAAVLGAGVLGAFALKRLRDRDERHSA